VAQLLALGEEDGAGPFGVGAFAADKLAFDQELPIDGFQGTNVDVNQLASEFALLVKLFDAAAEDLADLGAVGVGGARDEWEVGQVAGEADAAADDDVGLRSGAAQPFAAGLG